MRLESKNMKFTVRMQQDLTFEEAAQAFARYGVAFSEEKFIALGLRNLHDDRYTNLALLLSDQCQHTIKVAVFADEARTVFKDAKEFGGSLFRQLEDTYSYLQLCNRTMAAFHGLNRVEKQDYPEEALRNLPAAQPETGRVRGDRRRGFAGANNRRYQ